jgi:hypothetical protein
MIPKKRMKMTMRWLLMDLPRLNLVVLVVAVAAEAIQEHIFDLEIPFFFVRSNWMMTVAAEPASVRQVMMMMLLWLWWLCLLAFLIKLRSQPVTMHSGIAK